MYCYINDEIKKNGDQKVPWWSFGKVVLASAIMKLVELGKLDLNAHYFESKGKLEQILRHEAGYPDYYSSVYQQAVENGEEPWDFKTLIEKTQSKELLFQPGKGWSYSNIGYYYIRRLIEDTVGRSLQGALDELLFKPLGLDNVEVAIEIEQLKQCIHVKKGYHPMWLYHGMLIGTLEDACKFLHSLANGKIINQLSLSKMKEAYKISFDIGNRPWKEPGYGLGLMTDESSGSFGHTGMGPDSVIAVYHDPTVGCTVAISMETSNQGIVEYEVEKIFRKCETHSNGQA